MKGIERTAYPFRAWCQRLRIWVYLRGRPHQVARSDVRRLANILADMADVHAKLNGMPS